MQLLMAHLVHETRVCPPFEQSLDHFGVAILTGQMQGSESGVVDAVHKAEGSKESLDNVFVAIPCSLMQCSIAIL